MIVDRETTGNESPVKRKPYCNRKAKGEDSKPCVIVLKLLFEIFFSPNFTFPVKNRSVRKRLEHRNVEWWSRQNSCLRWGAQATLVCTDICFVSPALGQGDEKLVYRLIQLFSSTEIFSKRRKICSWWRKTRGNVNWKPRVLCWAWRGEPCGHIINIYYLHGTHA